MSSNVLLLLRRGGLRGNNPATAAALRHSQTRTMLNRIQIIGIVGREPEFRSFAPKDPAAQQSQVPRGVWRYSVATERSYRAPVTDATDGASDASAAAGKKEWRKETTWFSVDDFGDSGTWKYTGASAKVARGATVYVEGRMQMRVDEKTDKRYWNIVAEKVLVASPSKGPTEEPPGLGSLPEADR